MNKTTALSTARALLTFVGTYLIGHAVLGHTVTADIWTLTGGAVLTGISVIWSFTDKSTTPEAIQTGVRQLFVAIGGVGVAFGVLNQNTFNSLLALTTAILPVIQSAQAKVSAKQVATGSATVTDAGKIVKAAPKVSIVFLLILGSLFAQAQGPFRPQQPLGQPALKNPYARVINPITDSIVNNWRFGVSVSPAGFTLSGVYQAAAGLEFGLNHQDYNYASKKYTTLWSANFVWIPIQTATPIKSVKDIATFGVLYGIPAIKLFDYNVIQIGPFYNTQGGPVVNGVTQPGKFKDKAGVWVVANISL